MGGGDDYDEDGMRKSIYEYLVTDPNLQNLIAEKQISVVLDSLEPIRVPLINFFPFASQMVH